MQPARVARGVLLLLLFLELLWTVPWPWSGAPHKVPVHSLWMEPGDVVQYNSTALLRRSQAAMRYNKSTGQYETPPLAVWYSPNDMFYSKPADGLATWLDLMVTARFPWSSYWAFVIAPKAWHITPEATQQELSLFAAGVPVLAPIRSAQPYFSAPERWAMRKAGWHPSDFLPEFYALCTAAVDADTLRPVDSITCSLHDRTVPDSMQHSEGGFVIQPEETCPAAAGAGGAGGWGSCPHLGPGLLLQPLGRWLGAAAQRWRVTAALARVTVKLWHFVIPTSGLAGPLCPLLGRLHLLSYERPINAALAQTLVLVVVLRNWLYLITVWYKITRRLVLLAAHPLPTVLSGVALTLLGMFLGLWQSVTYPVMVDTVFEIVVYKLLLLVLTRCSLAAVTAWHVWAWVGLEYRMGVHTWQLARAAFREVRLLVLAPQALLVNNQALADRVPRRQVPTVGTWPAPLVIPEEVDELPVSEVPRGFICPITQAIMRQPALLLHDHTVNPSTYDKESIMQWLADHSTDPKNPGVQLCMRSVKLVYNGDLGRSIEDWVATKLQQRQQQQQQQQMALPGWARALSGHLDAHQHPDGAVGMAAAEGVAAAAAGVLAHMRGNMGGGGSIAPFAGAAAAHAGATDRGREEAPAQEAGGPAASGSILSGAGALVRTSSAALAQVAAMDLPGAAVAGLNRITTRALARRQQQQHTGPGGTAPRRQRQRQQQRSGQQAATQRDAAAPEDAAQPLALPRRALL